MEKISKKDIRTVVVTAMQQALNQLQIVKPSKKTSKLLDTASRKLALRLKQDVLKKFKQARKAESRLKKEKGKNKVGISLTA